MLLEEREHLGLVDRLLLADPGVEVGDQRDGGVAEAQLAGQDGLGVAGHVDHGPARAGIALGLGAGGEPRPLDHDHGAAVDHSVTGRVDHRRAQVGTVGVGEGGVGGAGVDEGLHPARGAVDELVGDDQGRRLGLRLQAADRARSQDLLHAEAGQRPDVRPVVDLVRRELVALPVAREEGDRPTTDVTDRDRGGRVAVRGGHLDRGRVVQELVEAAATDHGHPRVPAGWEVCHGRQSASGPAQARSVASAYRRSRCSW